MISDETLIGYALGELDPIERAEIEQHLAVDPALRRVLGDIQMALDGLPAVAQGPEEEGWATLFAHDTHRFLPYGDEIADIFDVSFQHIKEVLALFGRRDEEGLWSPTGVPGVSFIHFEAGDRLRGIDTGLVCFKPGASFPHHEHHGRELTYVVQGTLHMSGGQILQPGEKCLLHGGSHQLHAPHEEVLYLTFHEGLTVTPHDED